MSGLQAEISSLVGAMDGTREHKALDRPIYVGRIEGLKAVVVGSGVGKVRASAFAQFLIDEFQIKTMIIFGLAGALDSTLGIGDIVISKTAVMHDFFVAGEGVSEEIRQSPLFADEVLVNLAVTAGRAVSQKEVRVGTVLTGDSAIASSRRRAELRRDFNGDCVEMEGAAAALVCSMNSVPFVIVRAISDLADEQAHEQFENTFDATSQASFRVVHEMLKMMSRKDFPGPIGDSGSRAGQKAAALLT